MPFHRYTVAKTILLAAGLTVLAGPALPAGVQSGALAAKESADSKTEAAPTSSSLAAAAANFKAEPTEQNWQGLAQTVKTLLSDAKSAKVPSSQLEKANHELTDLGLKVIEAGAAELWTFPKIPQAREIFVRWQEVKAAAPVRRRQAAAPVTVTRVQAIFVPTSVLIKEAKLIDLSPPKVPAAPNPKDKKPVAASAPAAGSGAPKTDGGRFLIVSGADRATNALWLKSYKSGPEGWKENPQPLSGIPPVLLANSSGKLSFSGQDLMLTIRPGGAKPTPATNGNGTVFAVPESPSYRLALRLINGKYALEGKPVPDTPYNSVFQFVQALNQGRLDAAKGWLSDQKLISVAKYAGLSNKTPSSQLRIINMSGPPAAVYRFRCVTFERNDLVFDVVKTRTMWAIKAIFIAPSDPLIQQIARGLPALGSTAETSFDDEPANPMTAPAGTSLKK